MARLRPLSLFASLTPRELKVVDGLLHERRFLSDEVIFDKGDDGQAIYIIIEGRVSRIDVFATEVEGGIGVGRETGGVRRGRASVSPKRLRAMSMSFWWTNSRTLARCRSSGE